MTTKQTALFIVVLIFTILILTIVIITTSCASQPVDLGIHNPENSPEEDLITLYADGWCKIERIDNYEIKPSPKYNEYFIKLNPGVHTLFVKFDSGGAHTLFPMPVTARFEKGNMYYLDCDIEMKKMKVTYQLLLYNNEKKGKEVTGTPLENLVYIYGSYFDSVKSPVYQGKSVKLENNKYALVYSPDNIYTQTDKESGVTVKGKYLHANPDIVSAAITGIGFLEKVYLFDADAKIIREIGTMGVKNEINYGLAHTILILVNSTEKEIIYRYEKPLQLKGTILTFNITEVK